jgi:hypothetical protein
MPHKALHTGGRLNTVRGCLCVSMEMFTTVPPQFHAWQVIPYLWPPPPLVSQAGLLSPVTSCRFVEAQ